MKTNKEVMFNIFTQALIIFFKIFLITNEIQKINLVYSIVLTDLFSESVLNEGYITKI